MISLLQSLLMMISISTLLVCNNFTNFQEIGHFDPLKKSVYPDLQDCLVVVWLLITLSLFFSMLKAFITQL